MIWTAYYKDLLNGIGAASCLELPSNAQNEKGKATWADEVRLVMMGMDVEVGVKWTGRLLNVCMQE